MLALAFGFAQTSSAQPYREHYYHHRDCAVRYVPAPRAYYYAPQVYYAPVVVPRHFIINRWGERVWVRPLCR